MEPHTMEEDVQSPVLREEKSRFDWLAGKLLLLLAFLLPLFLIPAVSFPLQAGKTALFSGAVLLAFCLFVLARLKGGRFAYPNTPLILVLGLIVLSAVVSSLFSGSVATSFFGQLGETGTGAFILIAVLFTFLVSVLFEKREHIFSGFLAFIAAFFLLALFHLARLIFGPDFLSFGIIDTPTANTIGKWNDLGVFFAAATLLCLFTLEFLALRRLSKVLLVAALVASLFFVALVNFATIWFTLGLFTLVFLVYLISFGRGRGEGGGAGGAGAGAPPVSAVRRLPFLSLAVLVVSVVFLAAGGTLGSGLADKFRTGSFEARPSWKATLEVTQKTLASRPLFGAGPNQFVNEWLRFKPDGINQTIFWNVDFNHGIGLIPTFLATTGVLGFLAWILFFALFLYAGFKAVLSNFSDSFSRYLVTSSFLMALFYWIISIFYIPTTVNAVLAFFFTGLFVASLTVEKHISLRSLSFMSDPRAGFVSVLAFILLFIGAVAFGYALMGRYVAAISFEKGVAAVTIRGDLDDSEKRFERAVSLAPVDLYYRFLSELSVIRLGNLLGARADALSAEEVRSQFQSLLGTALTYAREATTRDDRNYQNFMQLGRVYEAVVPLRIEGAYESANNFYERALSLNPHSPAIFLARARLAAAAGDRVKARENISRALAEKGNYTEAIFLLSQIEAQDGNTAGAISSAEAAATLAPDDPTIFFQLGILRYSIRDFAGAATALDRATALNTAFANAKYFLGLSYFELKRTGDAVKQFKDLKETNPDNVEVGLILRNLEAGRAPFAGATPPIDDRPERRATPPLTDRPEP